MVTPPASTATWGLTTRSKRQPEVRSGLIDMITRITPMPTRMSGHHDPRSMAGMNWRRRKNPPIRMRTRPPMSGPRSSPRSAPERWRRLRVGPVARATVRPSGATQLPGAPGGGAADGCAGGGRRPVGRGRRDSGGRSRRRVGIGRRRRRTSRRRPGVGGLPRAAARSDVVRSLGHDDRHDHVGDEGEAAGQRRRAAPRRRG